MLDKAASEALLGGFPCDLWLPDYPLGACGDWAIKRIMMVAARGYWGEVYRIHGTVLLEGPGRAGKASWMSLTPSEIESQTIGLDAARGHTVVLGLGMGWLAANVALKSEVSHVTVVERNDDVLGLFEQLGVFDQLPLEAREKIEIVKADALEYRPTAPVDSMQADIWERFTEVQKLADVRRMQDNIGAKAVYFWGQEMEIWRAALLRFGQQPALNWDRLRSIVAEDISLPLILPEWPDYPAKITAAAPWWYKPD